MELTENTVFTDSQSARVKDEADRLARRGRIEEDDRIESEEAFGTGADRPGFGKPRKHASAGPHETPDSKRK